MPVASGIEKEADRRFEDLRKKVISSAGLIRCSSHRRSASRPCALRRPSETMRLRSITACCIVLHQSAAPIRGRVTERFITSSRLIAASVSGQRGDRVVHSREDDTCRSHRSPASTRSSNVPKLSVIRTSPGDSGAKCASLRDSAPEEARSSAIYGCAIRAADSGRFRSAGRIARQSIVSRCKRSRFRPSTARSHPPSLHNVSLAETQVRNRRRRR